MTESQASGGVRAWLWIGFWLGLCGLPLWLLLASPLPTKGGFWWNVAVAAGFVALALMVLQFFLTARVRAVTRPFGIDLIYYFHRQLAWVLCLLLVLHPLPLLWRDPALWSQLVGRWPMQSGALAWLLILLIMLSSVWRKRFGLAYQHWRRLHLLLALAATLLALAHVDAIRYYSAAAGLRGFWWLCLAAVLTLVLTVHLLRPAALLRRPWRITALRPEQGSCTTLMLQPEGHAGLQFLPGQFAWLSVGHSPFSLAEHPFSFSAAPQPDGRVQFTIKQLGDFTRAVPQLQPGTVAWVDGPYGVFSIDQQPEAPGYLFFGGGIGMAPLLSMLQALAGRGDTRPHVLFAAHSSFDRIPCREELVALAHRLDLRTVPVLEVPPPGWTGERGWFTTELLRRHLGPEYLGHHCFLCGPRPMTDLVERGLRELGFAPGQIHTELFAMA